MHLELFRKALRVALRARRRAEAWHRYRADARARQAEHIKRVRRHKQRQRGIETARKPNDRRFTADVLQSRRETRRLHFEDRLAACGKVGVVLRHKRVRVRRARRLKLGQVHRSVDDVAHRLVLPRIHAAALLHKALHVDVAVGDAVRKQIALVQ